MANLQAFQVTGHCSYGLEGLEFITTPTRSVNQGGVGMIVSTAMWKSMECV